MSADGTPVVPEPIATFIDVVNRHDDDAFLESFASDGFVDDWGRVFQGRAAIKQWSDREFIGSQGILTPVSVEHDGGRTTVVGDWRSSHANGMSRFDFVVEDGSIASMTIREG